ncbi:hypothetical protein [Nesterenkonia xinjiangensis]|uniref:Putative membrane protein n=1 Tax=Nesterenkonia xinjiangensis TaxID=225327 RepID=A0A7Z0GJ14_9MICC|nr:hypothetical protein [Nesterenkonia xinjiangensis]NYJ76857.1 putative membrane protein [Nesterenkonia xinjiangensis]
MVADMKIRRTRAVLLFILIAGLALGAFGLMIGIGLPGLILSVTGWIAFILAIVWLLVSALTRPAGPSHGTAWRPADRD